MILYIYAKIRFFGSENPAENDFGGVSGSGNRVSGPGNPQSKVKIE
jgi:hypothetical protein